MFHLWPNALQLVWWLNTDREISSSAAEYKKRTRRFFSCSHRQRTIFQCHGLLVYEFGWQITKQVFAKILSVTFSEYNCLFSTVNFHNNCTISFCRGWNAWKLWYKRLSDIKLFFNLWLGSFSKCLLWYHIPSLKVLLVTQLAKILILILRHFYPLRLSERTSALFVSGLCRWPGCDALSEDFPSFLK